MPTLPESTIAALLTPYLTPPPAVLSQLSLYLDLLLKWNARTNLTAIRDPEEIVRRHFGESLFAARHVPAETRTLLDFGSGAGFPGLPIALLHPNLQVTLAESQNKKSTFLREAVRTLTLPNVEVWPHRTEAMPSNRLFQIVTLRAVDDMAAALSAARARIAPGGHLLLLTTANHAPNAGSSIPLPNSHLGILYTESNPSSNPSRMLS
ncbi:MAG: 16S rRNA (guanine(527)-N(7))-methyltransferase RsmG [Edaphobacter sp.]